MRFRSVVVTLARVCSTLSALALVVMMLTSVADVALANVLKRPIVGAFDIVETTLVLVVFLGFPATFLAGSHIAVDVVDFFVSPATLARLKILARILSFAFLAFLAWQMIEPARDALKFGERKQELGLPLFALWAPMVVGIALAALAALCSVREDGAAGEGRGPGTREGR